MTHRLIAAAVLTLTGVASAQAVQTFDTPTATTAQTQAAYGVTVFGGIANAYVADGQLRLVGAGGVNGDVQLGLATDDVRLAFDTTIGSTPGFVNVGFSAGASRFYFHPGYWDRTFSIAGDGHLGFTPDWALLTHVTVDITAASKTFAVTLANGAHSHTTTFIDAAYEPGVSVLGLTMGAVAGYEAVFDNVSLAPPPVAAPVPEPASVALMVGGLLGLAVMTRRRR